jgi:hypothetical protein
VAGGSLDRAAGARAEEAALKTIAETGNSYGGGVTRSTLMPMTFHFFGFRG